jgi:hypothetical protein
MMCFVAFVGALFGVVLSFFTIKFTVEKVLRLLGFRDINDIWY